MHLGNSIRFIIFGGYLFIYDLDIKFIFINFIFNINQNN